MCIIFIFSTFIVFSQMRRQLVSRLKRRKYATNQKHDKNDNRSNVICKVRFNWLLLNEYDCSIKNVIRKADVTSF